MLPMRFVMTGLAGALLAATFLTAQCLAADVPPPIKKPRDKTGAVVTRPDAAQPKTSSKEAAQSKTGPAATLSAKTAAPGISKATGDTAKPAAAIAAKPIADPAKTVAAPVKPDPAKPATKAAFPATLAPPPPPKEWSAEEITAAKAHCEAVLKGVDAVSVPEPAFRDGDCGAAAPVRLISVGKNPQVSLDPPALLTCDMVAGLHIWLKQDVQPSAKKHLGSEVIRIETMSDYSCRNAYGRTASRLSEHGRANALDIRGFVTARAQPAYVLESWGTTQRELAEAEAAKLAAAAKAAAAAPPADTPAKTPVKANAAQTDTPPALKGPKDVPALGFQPARLGGPKEKDKTTANGGPKAGLTAPGASAANPAAAAQKPKDRTAAFLHQTHSAACQIFGTTLGPEANAAHRNHFHVDMAPRKTKKICD